MAEFIPPAFQNGSLDEHVFAGMAPAALTTAVYDVNHLPKDNNTAIPRKTVSKHHTPGTLAYDTSQAHANAHLYADKERRNIFKNPHSKEADQTATALYNERLKDLQHKVNRKHRSALLDSSKKEKKVHEIEMSLNKAKTGQRAIEQDVVKSGNKRARLALTTVLDSKEHAGLVQAHKDLQRKHAEASAKVSHLQNVLKAHQKRAAKQEQNKAKSEGLKARSAENRQLFKQVLTEDEQKAIKDSNIKFAIDEIKCYEDAQNWKGLCDCLCSCMNEKLKAQITIYKKHEVEMTKKIVQLTAQIGTDCCETYAHLIPRETKTFSNFRDQMIIYLEAKQKAFRPEGVDGKQINAANKILMKALRPLRTEPKIRKPAAVAAAQSTTATPDWLEVTKIPAISQPNGPWTTCPP